MLSISNLPFGKYGEHKEICLDNDLLLIQWIIEQGTKIKLYTGWGFCYIILPDGTKDKRGFTVPMRIFRF